MEKVPISTVFEVPRIKSVDERGVPISTVFEVEERRPMVWRRPAVAHDVQGWPTMALIGAGLLGYMLGKKSRRRDYGPLY